MPSHDSDGTERPADGAHLPPHLDPRGRAYARRAAKARDRAARTGVTDDLLGAPVTVSALGRRHGHGATARGAKLGAMVLAALLSATVLVGSGAYWYRYRQFTQDIVRLNVFAGASAPAKDIDGKDQNILLVGNDNRDGDTPAELAELGTTQDGGSLATDTMLVIHIPANGKNAVAISFPRDSYVAIPGYGMHKLNSAYGDAYTDTQGTVVQKQTAGAALLIQSIQNLTGLTINHFAQVNLYGFFTISNAIQGVRVCLIHAMGPAKYTGETGIGFDSGYEGDTFVPSYSGINLPAGYSTIQGKQALAFVRQRHGLPNGDLDRIKRQQYFLAAVFRKLTTAGVLLNPSKLDNLLSAVSKSLQLDPTLYLVQLAGQVEALSANNINFQTIPNEGTISTSDGDAFQTDPGQVQAFVEKLIGQSTSTAALAPSKVSLDIQNGAGVDGLATSTAATLKQAGFTIGSTGNASSQTAATTVEYPAGQLAQATTVAQYLPGARTTQTSSVSRVTLVLGTDGKKAIAVLPTKAPTTGKTTTAPAAPVKAADAGCIN